MKQSRRQGQEVNFAKLYTGTDTKIIGIYSNILMIKHLIFVKVNGQDDFAELQDTEVLRNNRISTVLNISFQS